LSALLLDTHAWAWLMMRSSRLSRRSIEEVGSAREVFVSPISFFEIGQKVRLGKWPEMAPFASRLSELLLQQGGRIATLTDEICLRAGTLAWIHRDPFDRIIVATAMISNLRLLSADPVFDSLEPHAARPARVW
jgi:PIN domain nuclease of toxin-antitoxin system